MSQVVIVDTSVLLNVLDVPAFNQNRDAVFGEFEEFVEAGASLLVPMAAVFETGDHIADLPDGRQRRRYAERYCEAIRDALAGDAPWTPIQFPDAEQLCKWLQDFPDYAMRGPDLSDLSIIKAWEIERQRHALTRVRIWSLDRDLQGYDHNPNH